MLKKYIKDLSVNSFYYGLGSAVRRFFSIFTAPIMTRIFTPSDYGIISMVTTTVAFAGMVITLGISAGIFRHYYERNEAERKELLFSGVIAQTLIIGSIILLIFPFMGAVSQKLFNSAQFGYILKLALLQLFIVELFEHFMTLLRFQKKPQLFLKISSLQLSLNLVFLLFFVAYLKLGIPGVYYGFLLAYLIPLLLLIINLYKYYSLHINILYIKECLAFSVPLIPGWFVNMYLAKSNKFFLNSYQSLEQVGLFSISEKIAGIVAMLMTVFFMAWNPVSMELIPDKSRHHLYDKIGRLFLFGSLMLVLSITLFAKEVLIILTSESYISAYKYAGLIAFGTMTYYLNEFLGQGIIIARKTIYQSYARLMGALIATVLYVILIPTYGGYGAAIGTIVGYGITSLLMLIIGSRLYYLPFDKTRIYVSYMFILMIIVVYLLVTKNSNTILISAIVIKLSILIITCFVLFAIISNHHEKLIMYQYFTERRGKKVTDE